MRYVTGHFASELRHAQEPVPVFLAEPIRRAMGTEYDNHHLNLPFCCYHAFAIEHMYTIEAELSTMEDTITTFVAQAVRQRREQLDLTLRALAVKSGVSSSMISDIERG